MLKVIDSFFLAWNNCKTLLFVILVSFSFTTVITTCTCIHLYKCYVHIGKLEIIHICPNVGANQFRFIILCIFFQCKITINKHATFPPWYTIVFCYLPMVDIVIINITQLICLSSGKSALLTNKVFFGIKKKYLTTMYTGYHHDIKFISPLTEKNSCCWDGQFKLKLAIVLIASKYRYITYTTV